MKKDKPKKRTREELYSKVGEFDSRFGYDGVGDRTQINYLSDKHIRQAMLDEGYVKTFEERTKRKKSIRTNTHRLLAKAEANIKAVGNRAFGVGH